MVPTEVRQNTGIDDFLASVRQRVDARLVSVLDEADGVTRALAPGAVPVLRAARELTLRGGKRLRPALLFAAVECIEPGALPEVCAELGAALELFQTYLLVHDDWMDGDTMRRGAPSVHVTLAKHFADAHIGDATAILSGDLSSALVRQIVSRVELPPERHRDVMAMFSQMEIEVILGQCLDVTHSDDVTRVHQLKTGSYTVRGPLAVGLAAVGASASARRAIENFGAPLGLAFQLRDDLLGVFGTASQTGKPAGSDLREGKHTELVRWALAKLDASFSTELREIVGKREAGESELARARALIESSGAREHVEGQIAALREESLAALGTDCLERRGREYLEALAWVLTERAR